MRITMSNVCVDNQDKPLRFHTELLDIHKNRRSRRRPQRHLRKKGNPTP